MPLPIASTYMPNDSLTAVKLNGDFKQALLAGFKPPRAKLVYNAAASSTSTTQARAIGWDTAGSHGFTDYDDAYDGNLMVNSGANGFLIRTAGIYRVRGRMTWMYLAAATSGVRCLALYLNYNSAFVSNGSNIGNPVSGIYGDPSALQWDFARFLAGCPVSAKIDITMPFVEGTGLQLGHFQNSGSTLNWQPGVPYIWFSCTRVG